LVLFPVATVIGLASCLEATAVRVHLFTDVAWQPGRRVAITAAAPQDLASAQPLAEISDAWSSTDLGDLVLLPTTDRTAPAKVLVVMGITRDPNACTIDSPAGCIFARRSLSFLQHRTLTLPIQLYATCIGVPCTADTTCNALGKCVPAAVDPTSCEAPDGCVLEGETPMAPKPLDGGTDAGPPPMLASVSPSPVIANVTTVAGSGTAGFADGTGAAAMFNNPIGVALDPAGFVYIGDFYNNRIRKISPGGVTSFARSRPRGSASSR
jgi:hypothetical protein